jgi:hypothetical protein
MTDAVDRLRFGDEATVRYEGRYVTSKAFRFRGVFLGQRPSDQSLTFLDERGMTRSAPADAEVVVHRKRKLGVPKVVRDQIDPDTGKRRKA